MHGRKRESRREQKSMVNSGFVRAANLSFAGVLLCKSDAGPTGLDKKVKTARSANILSLPLQGRRKLGPSKGHPFPFCM